MYVGAVIRTCNRCLARNLRALISLKSVIRPLRRLVLLRRMNGHLSPLHRSSSLPPFGTLPALSRSRKMRLPLTPQVTRIFDVIRGGGGDAPAATFNVTRAGGEVMPAPVAWYVKLSAPENPPNG